MPKLNYVRLIILIFRIQPGAGGDVSLCPGNPQKNAAGVGPSSPATKEGGMPTIVEQEEEELVQEEPDREGEMAEKKGITKVQLGDEEADGGYNHIIPPTINP